MQLTRRQFLATAPALGVAIPAAQGKAGGNWRLWYRQPAQRWLDALPVGNGRLGAMVFGGLKRERIALNESTVWSGSSNLSNVNPTTREYLPEMRRLLFEGKYSEGNALCAKHLCGREGSYGTHLPLGNLWIEHDIDTEAARYERSLELDSGVASVRYTVGATEFVRNVFASNPDDVIVIQIRSSRPKQVSLNISLDSGDLPGEVTTLGPSTLVLTGSSWEKRHSDGRVGVDFGALVRAHVEGGQSTIVGSTLQVRDADSVTMIIAANTSYNGTDFVGASARQLENASQHDTASLLARHIADHGRLFSRVEIDLGPGPTDKATDERLADVRNGGTDAQLPALFFQYGRYLLIAGSRENSPLPLNLQGIWNDGLAASMAWRCDFHLDINTEQNYWPGNVCNLSECSKPLFKLIESISRYGRSTARDMYGARGWVCHVYTNAWGFTAPGVGLPWGPFVTGGAWIASHLWQHYLFTGDHEFLRERAYPVLKSAAQFFLDYMVTDPRNGWLMTGPSISPENQFLSPDGERCSVSMGPTCDRELVFGLFSSCIEGSKILGVDTEFSEKLRTARGKLPPLQIGKYGQLQEWLHDFAEAEPNHRHTSHLIALYPLDQITPEKTPKLAEAARVTLQRRTSQKNWEDVEWSRANLINFYARLLDGDAAHKHVMGLLTEDTDNDLLTFSRSGVAGARQNIFAIDGNTAGTAGIAEMLLQSHLDLHLLPALPSAWPAGSVNGLRARGSCEVSIKWANGKLVAATLTGSAAGKRTVRYGERVASVMLTPGKPVHLDHDLRVVQS